MTYSQKVVERLDSTFHRDKATSNSFRYLHGSCCYFYRLESVISHLVQGIREHSFISSQLKPLPVSTTPGIKCCASSYERFQAQRGATSGWQECFLPSRRRSRAKLPPPASSKHSRTPRHVLLEAFNIME